MVNIKLALKRPFSDIKKLLFGLVFFHPILQGFFGIAYGLLCGKSSFEGKGELPKWEIKKLFFIGIKTLAILFTYTLVVSTVLWIVLYPFGKNDFGTAVGLVLVPQIGIVTSLSGLTIGVETSNVSRDTSNKEGAFTRLVFALFGFIFNLMMSAILFVFVINNKFKKAFVLKEIFRIAFSKKFILVWALFLPFDYILIFATEMLPVILWGNEILIGIHWYWFVLYGFFPAFLFYIYNITIRTLQGQVIKELKYRPKY